MGFKNKRYVKIKGISINQRRIELAQFKENAAGNVLLAIGAHPDDIEIDCAGVIANAVRDGKQIVTIIASDGARGGNPAVRKAEAQRAAELLGIARVYFLGFPDTRLAEFFNPLTQAIGKLLKLEMPAALFVHSLQDIAPDHVAVARSALLMVRNIPLILAYRGTPFYSRAFSPAYFVELDATALELKQRVLACFESQNAQDRFGMDYVEANAVYYGRMAGVQYAEGFELVKLVE